jgi:hypothetical protein
MIELGLDTAVEVSPGMFQAECPTAHALFLSMTGRRQEIGGRAVVWLLCAVCDALLHIGDDCDPTEPQWHLYNTAK